MLLICCVSDKDAKVNYKLETIKELTFTYSMKLLLILVCKSIVNSKLSLAYQPFFNHWLMQYTYTCIFLDRMKTLHTCCRHIKMYMWVIGGARINY